MILQHGGSLSAMAKISVFDIIKDLSHDKVRLIDQDPDNENLIKPYLINRNFSFGRDTVFYANEMNKAGDISPRMLYDYYFHTLRPKKRFNKWLKQDKSEYLDDVIKFYGYNYARATEALALLTMEQLVTIRESQKTGGKK